MRRLSNTRLLLFSLIATTGFSFGAAADDDESMRYLDNGVVRIGVDLRIGGAITYLSASGSDENIVNSYDWGRQVQMSFYSGPKPYLPEGQEPAPTWRFLGWNPIQSGDCFGNRSEVVEHRNDGTTLYVKCIPMQWPLDNVPGRCTFESWITLDDATAKVRSKINNARKDETFYGARTQELPAVYTNGPYYRLFTYDGDAPYTGGALRRITKVWDTGLAPQEVPGGPWDHWYATENWAALVNEEDFGVGVWSPGTPGFMGGFAGKPGAGGPKNSPTGYIAPRRQEILDHNIEYEYQYVLIVGGLEHIRKYVYDHADRAELPDYRFVADRQSWILEDGLDAGWPIAGGWQVSASDKAARLIGPQTFWQAEAMPRLYVEAAFEADEGTAKVRWERFGNKGSERYGQLTFDIVADGTMRTYEVDLGTSELYRGPCARLEILLPAGARVNLRRVSHQMTTETSSSPGHDSD